MLTDICDDIYDIAGIKAVIYDSDMNIIYSHPLAMEEFCSEVRKHKSLKQKCLECDKFGFSQCLKKGETFVYKCHMGLTEAVTPIVDNDIVIGFILFGQLLSEEAREEVKKHIKTLSLENEKQLIACICKKEATEERIISASARIVSMCASYVRLKNILNFQKESLVLHIKKYISQNLKDVTINKITAEFAISKGTLYNISKEEFKMGISQYIRLLRIKKAVALIKESEKPIYQIAEEVGILDGNYLTKLIKKETGKTPRQIKKESLQ